MHDACPCAQEDGMVPAGREHGSSRGAAHGSSSVNQGQLQFWAMKSTSTFKSHVYSRVQQERGCFVRECCPKGAAGDNVQGTIPKLSWSCLPAPAGPSPGRMCYQSNGAQGTPETRSKMNNPTLGFVLTPWRSISTNGNLNTTERRFAAAFISLPF